MNLKSCIKNTFLYLLLIFTVFTFLLRESSPHDIISAASGTNTVILLFGIVLMLFAVSCEGFILKVLLKVLHHDRPLRSCMRYAFAGHYFTSVTPSASGGQPAQLYYLSKDGIPVGSASVALLMYNMSYHAGIIGIYTTALVFRWRLIGEMVGAFKALLIAGFLIHAALLFFFLALIFRPHMIAALGCFLTKIFTKIKFIKRPHKIESALLSYSEHYRESAAYIKENLSIFLRIQPVTFLQVLIIFSVPFFVFQAFGLYGFNMLDLLAIQGSVIIIADSVPTPGGVGISEAAISTVYAQVFGSTFILPSVILCRLIGYYLPVAFSGIMTAVLSLRRLPNQ